MCNESRYVEVEITRTLKAVFEDGKFRPLDPSELPLTEGQRVRIIVETETAPDDLLALAGQVYAGLSEDDIDTIESIALDRRAFFDRTP